MLSAYMYVGMYVRTYVCMYVALFLEPSHVYWIYSHLTYYLHFLFIIYIQLHSIIDLYKSTWFVKELIEKGRLILKENIGDMKCYFLT